MGSGRDLQIEAWEAYLEKADTLKCLHCGIEYHVDREEEYCETCSRCGSSVITFESDLVRAG